MYTSGASRYLAIACFPMSSRPVAVFAMGQGVFANIILRNTVGSWHNTEIALTCSPNPPTCCGAPSSLAFFLRLQCSSCSITPLDMPIILKDIPLERGIKQESLPPPPITVGAMADITGCDPGALPAPLYVLDVVVLLLSTVLFSLLVEKSPVTSPPQALFPKSITKIRVFTKELYRRVWLSDS